MKLIIAGSRNIKINKDGIDSYISALDIPALEVVSGHSGNVDLAGEAWAEEWELPVKLFPAAWDEFGKSAGPIRNGQMAGYADGLLAIWDGCSKGTLNMIQHALGAGLKLWVITV